VEANPNPEAKRVDRLASGAIFDFLKRQEREREFFRTSRNRGKPRRSRSHSQREGGIS